MKEIWTPLGLTFSTVGFCICLRGLFLNTTDVLLWIGIGINLSAFILNYFNLKNGR